MPEFVVDASPRKPWYRRWFGTRSERAAARFLRQLGYRILVRNFSCHLGEIDLIALDKNCLVIVEVRSTERGDIERPAASVDYAKQDRLTRLALYFLQKKKLLDHAVRFDVLTISWPAAVREPTIVHFPHAFEATGKFQFYR